MLEIMLYARPTKDTVGLIGLKQESKRGVTTRNNLSNLGKNNVIWINFQNVSLHLILACQLQYEH